MLVSNWSIVLHVILILSYDWLTEDCQGGDTVLFGLSRPELDTLIPTFTFSDEIYLQREVMKPAHDGVKCVGNENLLF